MAALASGLREDGKEAMETGSFSPTQFFWFLRALIRV
jgi:hypothetical protein